MFGHTRGTWLALYEAGVGRKLTDDEVVFAYLVAKNADRVAVQKEAAE